MLFYEKFGYVGSDLSLCSSCSPVPPPSSRNLLHLPILSPFLFFPISVVFHPIHIGSLSRIIWVVWWFRKHLLHPAKSGNYPLSFSVIIVRKYLNISPLLVHSDAWSSPTVIDSSPPHPLSRLLVATNLFSFAKILYYLIYYIYIIE